jgi:hypothetical protein
MALHTSGVAWEFRDTLKQLPRLLGYGMAGVRPSDSRVLFWRFMVRQPPKPLTAHASDWGATGSHDTRPRILTGAQYAEKRRKRADLDAKLRQLTSAERDRRR